MLEQLQPANDDDDSHYDPDDQYSRRDDDSGADQSIEHSPLPLPLNWKNLPSDTWSPVVHALVSARAETDHLSLKRDSAYHA